MKSEVNFLQGNIKKLILLNAIPALSGIILLSVDSFLDGLLISRMLGLKALGGLTLVSPLLIFQSALGSLVASGASILMSNSIGEDNKEKMKQVFINLHILAVVLSIIGYASYYYAGNFVLQLLSNDVEEIKQAHAFYQTFSAGSLIIILALSYGSLMRSSGEFKKVSIFLGISVLINIACSILLIPIMGIAGCAIGTLISMAAYALLNLIQIVKKYPVTVYVVPELIYLQQIFKIGLSSFLFQLSSILRQAIIIRFIQYQSNNDIALYGAMSRILSIILIPAQAIIQSFQPTYITNLGAQYISRCKSAIRITTLYGFFITLGVSMLTFIFSSLILSWFLNEPVLTTEASDAFRICLLLSLFYPVSALSFVLLQSSGHHSIATVIASTREIILLLPILILFNQFLQTNTVYWAILAEVIIYTTIIYWLAHYKTSRQTMLTVQKS